MKMMVTRPLQWVIVTGIRLYEKACEFDVPLHIHTAGSRNPQREPYSLYFVNEETTTQSMGL